MIFYIQKVIENDKLMCNYIIDTKLIKSNLLIYKKSFISVFNFVIYLENKLIQVKFIR